MIFLLSCIDENEKPASAIENGNNENEMLTGFPFSTRK